MPTPRIVDINGVITQGYTRGKTRGATILYATPQAALSTLGWLQVVTGTGVAAGAIVGKGRQQDPRVSPSFLAANKPNCLKNQKLATAISGVATQWFTGDAGIQTGQTPAGQASGDFGVVRAGHYIIMGANVSNQTGFVNASTFSLANKVNAEAVLAGASDTGGRVSVHNRVGGNETKVKQYLLALNYTGGSSFTYPVFTTVQTDGMVSQLDGQPTGTNPIYSGTALSGLVTNESIAVGQAQWGQGAVITVAGGSVTGLSGNISAANAGKADLALPRLTLPGVICFSINGKVPTAQGYSVSAANVFAEDVVW